MPLYVFLCHPLSPYDIYVTFYIKPMSNLYLIYAEPITDLHLLISPYAQVMRHI